MQCTYSGSYGIGITATSIIFYGSNQQSGFTYPSGPSTYIFTYYAPANLCPWYITSSLSTNCWMSQQLTSNQIPLNNKNYISSISVHQLLRFILECLLVRH